MHGKHRLYQCMPFVLSALLMTASLPLPALAQASGPDPAQTSCAQDAGCTLPGGHTGRCAVPDAQPSPGPAQSPKASAAAEAPPSPGTQEGPPQDVRTVSQAVVRVEGLGEYASLSQALAAVESAPGSAYTLTLLHNAVLEADAASGSFGVTNLPKKSLTIDGQGHTLSASSTTQRNYLHVYGDLTLANVTLAMGKTYLLCYGDGAALTIQGSVKGKLEKVDDESAQGCTITVSAPVSKSIVAGIVGNGKSTQIILKGYGSAQKAATRNAFPAIGSSADKDKPGTLVLENSYLVADYAYNWGPVEVRTAGGLSITGTMQYATVNSYTAPEAGAVLTLKKHAGGYGCLKVDGAVGGKTLVRVSGAAPQVGDVLIQAPRAAAGAFVLEGTEGLALERRPNGDFAVVQEAVHVTGGALSGLGFASLEDALAAIQADLAAGQAGRYTLTLHQDAVLSADTTLPDAPLTLDGQGHTLSAAGGVTALNIPNDLTIQQAVLALPQVSLYYTPNTNAKRTIELADSVSGQIDRIVDASQSRYLDIKLGSDKVAFNRIIGTTSTIGTRLTDVYLTGFGSAKAPVDLAGKLENLAAVELENSYLSVSGDAGCLGVVRVASAKTPGGLVLTDDTTLHSLSVWKNMQFTITLPADKALTLSGQYNSSTPIPLTVSGTPADGHVLVHTPTFQNKKQALFTLADPNSGAILYWNKPALRYEISLAPAVAAGEQAVQHDGVYTSLPLMFSDAQGLASLQVNGRVIDLKNAASASYAGPYLEGDNTLVVTDITGQSSTLVFQYETAADYAAVTDALAQVPQDLSGYTPASVQALQNAIESVVYGLPRSRQDEVTAMADAIRQAVSALEKAEAPIVIAPSENQQPPKTGDPARPLLFFALALLAGGGAALLAAVRRRSAR